MIATNVDPARMTGEKRWAAVEGALRTILPRNSARSSLVRRAVSRGRRSPRWCRKDRRLSRSTFAIIDNVTGVRAFTYVVSIVAVIANTVMARDLESSRVFADDGSSRAENLMTDHFLFAGHQPLGRQPKPGERLWTMTKAGEEARAE
jgi:hypothetical protein